MARALTTNQPVSLKYSLEIGRTIKGKNIQAAEKMLNDIISQKQYLPLRTYTKKVPHRKGTSVLGTKAGRYPQKTCHIWLNLLNSVKANADVKGLDSQKLQIIHATAFQGFQRIRNQSQGRISGKARKAKSAHLEIVVREAKS